MTLPVFIMIVGMFADYGWVFFQKAMLDNAIHEGCRQGAVSDPTRVDPHVVADTAIKDQMDAVGQPCDGSCTITLTDTGVSPAVSLMCVIERPVTSLTGISPVPANLGASTLMRYEFQDEFGS
jgi:hypothetical protein